MLQRLGHRVDLAQDGQQALEIWKSRAFDAILMDIQMPVMDGCQAAAAIREQQRALGSRTPIIALTAYAQQGDRERLLAEGFDGYIAKPVTMRQLAAELQRVTLTGSGS